VWVATFKTLLASSRNAGIPKTSTENATTLSSTGLVVGKIDVVIGFSWY